MGAAKLSVWLVLYLCISLAAAAQPEKLEVEKQNADYRNWAALEEGSWVKIRITGDLRHADWRMKLAKVTPEEVLLNVTETRFDEPPREPWQERIKAAGAATSKPVEAGEEKLKVGDATLHCRWETRKRVDEQGGESGETVWTSDGVPGFVKRVTWLAPDEKAGLKAATTTETLIGYNLRPRPTPDGKQPAPQIAGEAGPTRFKWTYTFDPPGWRKWERTGEKEWVERWETGEVSHFEIDRRIDDGERKGTVVIRIPDRELETVIPDEGAGATLWFRPLPDGEWTVLGEIEESD